MTVNDKSKQNRALAYELLDNNYYNASANRFYYSCFQKLFHLASMNGYQWESGKSSHTALITYTDTKINTLLRDETKRIQVMRARGITGSFRKLKGYREKADYLEEDITSSDMEKIKKGISDFDNQFEQLKQVI